MRPFRFRLERILHLGESQKQQLAVELAARGRELDRVEDELRNQQETQAIAMAAREQLSGQGGLAAAWTGAQLALASAVRQVRKAEDGVRSASLKVEESRDRLIEQSREVETYSRLCQRRREEHRDETLRLAQRDIDEVANTRRTRNSDETTLLEGTRNILPHAPEKSNEAS